VQNNQYRNDRWGGVTAPQWCGKSAVTGGIQLQAGRWKWHGMTQVSLQRAGRQQAQAGRQRSQTGAVAAEEWQAGEDLSWVQVAQCGKAGRCTAAGVRSGSRWLQAGSGGGVGGSNPGRSRRQACAGAGRQAAAAAGTSQQAGSAQKAARCTAGQAGGGRQVVASVHPQV